MAAKKSKSARTPKEKYVGCTLKMLPAEQQLIAAEQAIRINPNNAPTPDLLPLLAIAIQGGEEGMNVGTPWHLAVSRYWGSDGVRLSVSFMDNPAQDLRDRIMSHLNAWGEVCNVQFSHTQGTGQVRIARARGGYWSYLGPDILQIPSNQATMNLEGFTMNTPESEFVRVIRHEAGHTLGYPHEHMRRAIVSRLDPQKTIDYFQRYQGWPASVTRQQVLTPLEESSIMGTVDADQDSIMCYSLPASITRDNKPINGGKDIGPNDAVFANKIYPRSIKPPPVEDDKVNVVIDFVTKKLTINGKEWIS